VDERTGAVHDYTRKSDIQHSKIMAPEGALDWSLDRPALWNAVEVGERRKDAQLAREVQLALPRELDADRQIAPLPSFVRDKFVSRGMVEDFSLHDHTGSDGQPQPHAHVMLNMRSIDETGFGLKVRDWNSDELLVHWREQWAHQANAQLAEAGEEARIDHRTLATQRAEAQVHASAEPQGERRDALEVRAAEMDREPSPYLRASWYMEQKARQLKRQGQRMSRLPIAEAGWRRYGRLRPSGWRPCGCSRRTWHSELPRRGGIGRGRTGKRCYRPQRATIQPSDCNEEGKRLKRVSLTLNDPLRPNCCNGPGRSRRRGRGKAYRDLTACSAPGRSPRIRRRQQRARVMGKDRSKHGDERSDILKERLKTGAAFRAGIKGRHRTDPHI
jgi:hypothetical protein